MEFIKLLALHFCMATVFSVLLLLNFVTTVYSHVTLNVQPDIIRINQNINITCTVHGIDIINNNLTRQWSKGPDLICYNGHPIDSIKYTEILTAGNQFKLQIKNISESDVNYKYQCRYGFDAQSQNIQASKDNFEYPPTDDMRAIVHQNESNRFLTVNLHFMKIFPLPTCTAIIGGSSLPLNITSSKRFGNYYEVMLHHQSKDKLHENCNEEVVVKCKLIKEYIIPTRDLRKCSFEENTSKDLKLILMVSFISILVLVIFISFLIICKPRKTEDDEEDKNKENITELVISKIPCLAIHDMENSTSSSESSNYTHQCLDEHEVFLSIAEDKEIKNKVEITETLLNDSKNQKDTGNMNTVEVRASCLSSGNFENKCDYQ